MKWVAPIALAGLVMSVACTGSEVASPRDAADSDGAAPDADAHDALDSEVVAVDSDDIIAVDSAVDSGDVVAVDSDDIIAVDSAVDSGDIIAVDSADTRDGDLAPDTTDTLDTFAPDTAPDTAPDSAPDTAVDTTPDTGPEVSTTPIGTVTWTIRTGDNGSEDDVPGTRYCLDAAHCATPTNALNWNDRDPRSVDVWHAPGNGLTRADIDRVEIQFPSADTWQIACVEVAVDGEVIHCAMVDPGHALLGTDAGAAVDYRVPPTLDCHTCWDGVLTHGPVVGGTSDHDARIWVRTDAARAVTLRVGSEPATVDESAPIAIATPRAGDDFTHTFVVPDLAPATAYFYTIVVAGPDGPVRYPLDGAPPWRFETAPRAGEPARFTFAIGSCARADIDKVPSQPAFLGVEAAHPDFFLFVGDNVYFDPLQNGEITNLAGARAFYREGVQRRFSWASAAGTARADFGRDARATVLSHTPTFAVWDDHDFLHDNSYGVRNGVPLADREWALQAFREYWPNPTYGEHDQGIYHRLRWGDVDVFMVDGRYFKDGGDRSTILGAAQRAWLFEGLRSSTAVFKVVADGSDWSTESVGDSWAGTPGERQQLFDWIASQRIEGLVLVGGDSHRSEIRLVPGPDGSYPIPQLISSGIATVLRSCPQTNELFEVSGAPSCWGGDGGNPGFVSVAVDTTVADPTFTAFIRDTYGNVQRSATFRRSALSFRARAPLSPRDADFDGDGYADLAIGIAHEDTNAPDDGLVQVYLGTPAGLHTRGGASFSQASLSGANEADDRFGEALAHGDVDGDGYTDLVIGVPGEDYFDHPGTGRAVVLRGSAEGLRATTETLDLEATAAPIDQRVGTAIALGDFDGDGRDDVALGAPGEGGVRLWLGATGPLVRGPVLVGAGDAAARWGEALAAGDFDGDGFDDLAVGAPGDRAVVVYFGGALGLGEATAVPTEDANNPLGSELGVALAADDLDGDGFDDLAIGAPGWSGFVLRFRGGPDGLREAAWWTLSELVPSLSPSLGDQLGAALATGDFDGDGVADLAIGCPGRSASRGIAVVRLATGEGWVVSQDLTSWTVAQPGDRFGAALTAGDYDADGFSDLAVGAPEDVINGVPAAGVVDVLPGRHDGFEAPLAIHGLHATQRWSQALLALSGGGGPEAGDRLGASLSR